MRTSTVLLLLLLACASACGKKDDASGKPDDKPAAMTAKPADVTGAKPAPATPAAPGSVGVPECDEYVSKYLKCIDKMPPDGRQNARVAMNQAVDAWKSAAGSADLKSQLATACKSAMETQKQATQSIGCEW